MQKSFYFIVLFIFLVPFSVFSKEVVLTSGEYAPYTSQKHKDARFIDEMVIEAYKTVGVNIKLDYYPWKRSYKLAEDGVKSAGTYPWHKTAEREKSFYFSDSIFDDKEVFFHLKDVDFKWKELTDLRDYKVGGSRGYYYVDKFIKLGINVDVANSDELNYKKLLKKRIDVFPNSMVVGYYQINKLYDRGKAALFTNSRKPLSVSSFYLMISKNRTDGKELIDLFNKGLKNIKKNGVYDQIMDKAR